LFGVTASASEKPEPESVEANLLDRILFVLMTFDYEPYVMLRFYGLS